MFASVVAGSLMNLAKHPSSTVQILGAEKALFRCMRACVCVFEIPSTCMYVKSEYYTTVYMQTLYPNSNFVDQCTTCMPTSTLDGSITSSLPSENKI